MRHLIAILRGVRPEEVEGIAEALIGAGVRRIETPLNSPEPFESVSRLARRFGADAEIGAGTVLTPEEADRVADAGGTLIVSPNADPAVIAAAKARGMRSAPGVFTATEAFAALHAGADALKLFPASQAGPGALKALRDVLPTATPVYAVGGVAAPDFAAWAAAGATGFGLGGALYKPGDAAPTVGERAQALVAAYDAAGLRDDEADA